MSKVSTGDKKLTPCNEVSVYPQDGCSNEILAVNYDPPTVIIIDHNGNHTLHRKYITSFEHKLRVVCVAEQAGNCRHFYVVTDRC
jgi:hypothetical protein